MKTTRTLSLLLALAAPIAALAHSDDYLDTLSGPHGGQLRMAAQYHYELVVGPGTLAVYVTDHADKGFDTAGAKGRAILLSKGVKHYLDLQPAGGNALSGRGDFELDPGMKVVVTVTMPGAPPLAARFTPLAPRRAKPGAADDEHAHHHH